VHKNIDNGGMKEALRRESFLIVIKCLPSADVMPLKYDG